MNRKMLADVEHGAPDPLVAAPQLHSLPCDFDLLIEVPEYEGLPRTLADDPLPALHAIAVALLANEVVTNAYKHAFPNNASGKIAVALCRRSNNTLILQITDDGIGLRTGAAGGGFGLKLVRTFAAQLGGVLTVATPGDAPGTAITLTMSLVSTLGRRRTDASEEDAMLSLAAYDDANCGARQTRVRQSLTQTDPWV